MCKVSDKIKFCTCVDDSIEIEELNNYWVLHRYNKDKDMSVMGEPILPNGLQSMFEINKKILVDTLNSPEAFDKKIEIKEGDKLEVVLCNNSSDDTGSLYYNFSYSGKIWKSIESDSFDIMSKFDPVNEGGINDLK